MRLVPLLALAALAACADPAPAPEPAPPDSSASADALSGRSSVTDVVAASPRLRTLARLLQASGVAETLRDTSTAYTLFAPSDEALATLGEDGLAALEADPEAARTLLLGHVLPTRMLTFDMFDMTIESMGGAELSPREEGEGYAVTGPAGTARITDADLDADNGVVQIVDGLLVRP